MYEDDFCDLRIAIEEGDLEKVKKLVEEEGKEVNACDDEQTSVLSFAMQTGNTDIIIYLLQHGADPLIPDDNICYCFDEEPIREMIVKQMLQKYSVYSKYEAEIDAYQKEVEELKRKLAQYEHPEESTEEKPRKKKTQKKTK